MRQRIKTAAELGLLVRATRKACGLRLDEAAGSAQLGHVFVRHVEHGKETAQVGKVLQLLEELGIHLEVNVPDAVAAELDRLKAKGLRPVTPRRPAAAKDTAPDASR